METYKVIVAHPGKQHSFQTVRALKKSGIDVTYVTTVYDKKKSLTNRLKSVFLKGDELKRANSRRCEDLNEHEVKQFCEFRGLLTLLLLRVDKTKKIYRAWNNYVFACFGKKVAKYALKKNADLIIMYDANAKTCFEYLDKHNSKIIKVLDVSIAVRPYQKIVYEKDVQESGLDGLLKEQSFLWKEKYQQYYLQEIKYSDYFICPSTFVKNSLKFCNVVDEKIFIVPYGVQLEQFKYSPRIEQKGPLRLVMTGQVNYRKGFHHMLRVMDCFSEEEVELTVFGTRNEKDKFFKQYSKKKNILYRGFVTQDKIIETYKQADVYIFPSLCEGLSLSVLEAMSCGLPVILSDNSGANDLVEQEKNGVVFRTGNDAELKQCIRWYLENRGKVRLLGENAYATALKYSWDAYYYNYGNAIKSLLDKR